LPSFGDVQTGWLGVVSAGAGGSKGMIALPAPGDLVLVLLANEDPAQAVVLGGLYGAEGPFDPGVVSGTVQRYSLRTPGGRLIRLDDENQTIRVEDSQGNFVEMTPEQVRVHSESRVVVDSVAELTIRADADLTIEAPGKAIRIRAKSIDFETA
jgi:phage baseplate assembly protein gpV